MPNSKDELKAHEDRAKRARSNIAKFKRLMAHNALVLKLEQQRAARIKKKITNTGERSAAVKWALSTVGVVVSLPHPLKTNKLIPINSHHCFIVSKILTIQFYH